MKPESLETPGMAREEDDFRASGRAAVLEEPGLVPDRAMKFGDWAAWVVGSYPAFSEGKGQALLPFIHAAAMEAITVRDASDPWPAFTRAMRAARPDMAPDATVFDVDSDDGGRNIDCKNVRLTAARIVDGQIEGPIYEKAVAKVWLREFLLDDEIEQAKLGLGDDILAAAIAEGWRVGHDPKERLHGAILIHEELDVAWLLDDCPGAIAFSQQATSPAQIRQDV